MSRSRGIALLAGAVLLLTLIGLALVLQDSRSQSRRDLVARFDQRKPIAGALLQGLVSGIAAPSSVPDSLKHATVPPHDLASAGNHLLFGIAVYSARQGLLGAVEFAHGSPPLPRLRY